MDPSLTRVSDAPIYICGPSRTPIGKFGGGLASMMPADLGVPAAAAAMERAGVKPDDVDECVWGHGRQAGGGPNTGRQVALRSGMPDRSVAYTVNKACGSSLFAIVQAARTIRLGEASVILAGGSESMSNTPYLLPRARWGYRMGHDQRLQAVARGARVEPAWSCLWSRATSPCGGSLASSVSLPSRVPRVAPSLPLAPCPARPVPASPRARPFPKDVRPSRLHDPPQPATTRRRCRWRVPA